MTNIENFWSLRADDTANVHLIKSIMQIVLKHDFWLIGGVLRDLCSGRTPKDIDILTPRYRDNGFFKPEQHLAKLLQELAEMFVLEKIRGQADDYPLEQRDTQVHVEIPNRVLGSNCHVLSYMLQHKVSDFSIKLDFVDSDLYRRFLDADINGMILRQQNKTIVLDKHCKAPPLDIIISYCQRGLFTFMLPMESRKHYVHEFWPEEINEEVQQHYWIKSLLKREGRLLKLLNNGWIPTSYEDRRNSGQNDVAKDMALYKHVTDIIPLRTLEYCMRGNCHLCGQAIQEKFVCALNCRDSEHIHLQAHYNCVMQRIRDLDKQANISCSKCDALMLGPFV